MDDGLARGAVRLRENDFHRAIGQWKGHWIIIAIDFAELDTSEGCQILRHHVGHMTLDNVGTYTYIFRPNKSVRNQLYELTRDSAPTETRQRALDAITIDHYEPLLTGRSTANILDEDIYTRLAGNFQLLEFPNPTEEDALLLGDRVQQPIHQEVSCTFVKALRDVISDLRNYRDSPLLNLLRGTESRIKVADSDSILKKIGDLNAEIAALDEIRKIASGVQASLHDTVGHTYSPGIDIRSGIPEELDRLLQRLCLTVCDSGDDGYRGELDELSLGGANLIYLSLKLLEYEMKTATDRVAHFLLIEEPESHIHTHIQKTLFDKYNYNNTQVIVSTHSTHISAASRIRSVNILTRHRREAQVFHPANGLTQEQCQRVERYLDAVRSTLLFAKGVVLVEGDAELVLIPSLVRQSFGVSLDEIGISLINMSSAVFSNLVVLFHDHRVRRRCAILTDSDTSIVPLPDDPSLDDTFQKGCRASEVSGRERQAALDHLLVGNTWVTPFYAPHTFEVDFLMAGNSAAVVGALGAIYSQASRIDESSQALCTNDVSIAGREVLRLADKVGKGWFAVLMAEGVNRNSRLPSYVVDAIAFAARDSVESKTVLQMIRHRCTMVHPAGANRIAVERAVETGTAAAAFKEYRTRFASDELSRFIELLE